MTYVQPNGSPRGWSMLVEVQLHNGRWVEGWLEAYCKVQGVWSGFVRYTLAPDATHLGWFEEERIRGHGE
jgi:hypothetical protein